MVRRRLESGHRSAALPDDSVRISAIPRYLLSPLSPLSLCPCDSDSLVLVASQYLAEGSEKLLTLMGPGVIGGLIIPMLGAFPEAFNILSCALGLTHRGEEGRGGPLTRV